MEQITWNGSFLQSVNRPPDAVSYFYGSSKYPEVQGEANFWQTDRGTLVAVSAIGLPSRESETCDRPVFGLHIHAGGSCEGTGIMPFPNAGGHYNPEDCVHPGHAGDLPPLFSNNGDAWMAVMTDRFLVDEVIGRTVILHNGVDDFKTQPTGTTGERMACGVIMINTNAENG